MENNQGLNTLSSEYVRFLPHTEDQFIDECDGRMGFGKEGELFVVIADNVKNWGYKQSKPTPKMPVRVGDLIKNGMSREIHKSFGLPLGQHCSSPHQVRKFVTEENTKQYLLKPGTTSFLIREDETIIGDKEENFFVVDVIWRGGKMDLHGYRLMGGFIWYANHSRRFILPQPLY